MPNHCENDLYITGPVGEVNALLCLIGADKDPPDFNCGAVIPYPEEFASRDRDRKELDNEKFREKYGETAKDGFNSGGYEWRCENWGTKWGAYQVSNRKDGETVILSFQSAWSPPSPVIVALHGKFPACTLHLEYFECGVGYCGGFTCPAKEDYCEEEDGWKPGIKASEWEGAYHGHRGG